MIDLVGSAELVLSAKADCGQVTASIVDTASTLKFCRNESMTTTLMIQWWGG